MRICALTHNLQNDNGGGVLSRRVLFGVKKKLGASLVVFTTVPSGEPDEQAILLPNIFAFMRALPNIRRAIKTSDIVHAFDAYPYGMIAALASVGLQKKIILTAVGTGSVRHLYHKHWLLTPLTTWAFKRATKVVAISQFTKDLITKHLPELSITVIHPGVDYEAFTPTTDAHKKIIVRDTAGVSHSIENMKPYIVSVGSVRWRKGYKRSLKAFARVREQFPNLKYVIVGRTHWKKYFQELLGIITSLNLTDSVIFLDSIDDVASLRALYQNAQLFCLLSQDWGYDVEGFGMVFIEAAAAGLPVVGADKSGVVDAVQNGVNGFLVDREDEQGFAQAIAKIVGDATLRSQMGKASLTWAQTFDWDARIREYTMLYKRGMVSSIL